MSTCLAALQYHQRWRSQRLSRGLWWETPLPSPALSPEASPWVATPTHGCTMTPSLSVKLATCWLSVSWQNPTLVSTAVRWPTLLEWVAVTVLPLSLVVSISNLYSLAPTFYDRCKALEREKEKSIGIKLEIKPGTLQLLVGCSYHWTTGSTAEERSKSAYNRHARGLSKLQLSNLDTLTIHHPSLRLKIMRVSAQTVWLYRQSTSSPQPHSPGISIHNLGSVSNSERERQLESPEASSMAVIRDLLWLLCCGSSGSVVIVSD